MIQIDMPMPKSCRICPLHDVNTEQCPLCIINKDDYAQSRYEFCPLQEVATDEDTVSRKQAIEVAMQYCPDDDGTCSKSDRDIRELLDDLENLPPSQPQRTGRWINAQYPYSKCSICGEELDTLSYEANYCPNCGARMEDE